MNDPDADERWLTQAFAQVEVPPGVEAWRDLNPTRDPVRNGARRLRAIGLTAGIAAVLFSASVAGTLALTHSHPSPPATVHLGSAPAATHAASPPAQAATSACSRLQTGESPMKGMQFDPPGAAEPTISCARAMATLLCPPNSGNYPCPVLHGSPVKAQLVRMTVTAQGGRMGEVRGEGFPFVGPSFVPRNLLVWQLTWVPTVCNSYLPAGFPIFFPRVSTPCGISYDYLIDASTGDFVFFDTAHTRAG
jgi:hypothetical protein